MVKETINQGVILVIIWPDEGNYLYRLANLVSGHKIKVFSGELSTVTQLELFCTKNGITKLLCTRQDVLRKLLPPGREAKANISNYAGSLFTLPNGGELVIIPPLKQLITVSYMEWLMKRFISKLTAPHKWRVPSQFNWELIHGAAPRDVFSVMGSSYLVGVDIETSPPIKIRSIGYTCLLPGNKSKSFVLPLETMDDVHLMRQLNLLPTRKVLQNGKYDIAYLAAYRSPLVAYYHDTVNAMHAWYSELPKDLAFIQSLFIRKSMYWKDLAASGDVMEQHGYNAMDTWSTAESYVSWLEESPPWAKVNYVKEFSQVPICHMMEMTGIKRDMPRLEKEANLYQHKLDTVLARIRTSVGHDNFNPSSPVQTKKLLKTLGLKKIESSDEKTLQSAMLLHPLNERILGDILTYRGERKLLSTYLSTGDKAKEFRGRILWSINPHGTDTGRKSSKEHHFWCGLQGQNIPGDGPVKETMIADEGYDLYEFDFAQAEARGVAYCSGDLHLIAAVESPRDFHSTNASAFFGVPYEQIRHDATEEYVNPETGELVPATKAKTVDKHLRNLAKRVNHGANYNMGPGMLLITMGEKNVRHAQQLLKLPKEWNLLGVCKYLLDRYEMTYPRVKGAYYARIKADVRNTSKLVGATGWTRWCFGDPSTCKGDLNAYIAHVTQSLNAMILDEAILRVSNKYLLDERRLVKFMAQIHDSLFVQIKKGREQQAIAADIKNLMTFPVQITDCIGKFRQMIVPVDAKRLGLRWSGNE